MKKKILIALFVVLTVCLFAFSVNAANEVTLTDGKTVDLATVFKINASNQITGFNTGYDKNMVTDVIFPDEIEGLEADSLFNEATNLNSLTFEATDTFFISGVNIFYKCSVKTITFNPDCVVELRKGNFSGCTSLTQITFPKFKKLAGSAFYNCSNMVATNDIIFVEGITEIGDHAFEFCTNLTSKVSFPSTLETIKECAFSKSGLTAFDFSKCANLSTLKQATFSNSDSITTLDMSGCTSLENLSINFAEGCDGLTSVILPPNLKGIPYKAFAHCYKLQSIVLPASMETIADESFHSVRKGQSVMTFTVYIQGNVKLNPKYVFRDTGAKIEFVLLGNSITAEQFKTTNADVDIIQNGSNSPLVNIAVVDYKDPASPWTFTPGQTRNSHVIVENYCIALALTNEHASDNNPCVINCSSCELVAAKENPIHKESISIAYENGYDSEGVKLITCTNNGCGHKETVKLEALFVCLGYSAPEYGTGGIAVGFMVDDGAIAEYEAITEKTVRYGVFAVSQDRLDGNEIFGEDGATSEGVVSANMTAYETAAFELKITGFTDEQKDTRLAMGAYVCVTGEEATEYSYMQDDTKGEKVGNYYFVSYNVVVGNASSEEAAQ